MFVVFAQPTGPTEPGKGAFDDPAARQELEVGKLGAVFDDFQSGTAARTQLAHPPDQCARITAVGPNAAQPTETVTQGGEQQAGAVAVLQVGRMHADQENQSQGIDQKVSLSSCHLLASIVAANSSLLSCAHALRVEDRSGGGFFFPAFRRTASRNASLSWVHTPCFFQCAK